MQLPATTRELLAALHAPRVRLGPGGPAAALLDLLLTACAALAWALWARAPRPLALRWLLGFLALWALGAVLHAALGVRSAVNRWLARRLLGPE